MSSKRKLTEMSSGEKTDAVVQLEKRLNAEFDRAHGVKAVELEKAYKDAQTALITLKAVEAVANQPHNGTFNHGELQAIYNEFDKLYPRVEVSSAFEKRNPVQFGFSDRRTDAKKQQDEKFRERDAPILDAIRARTEALIVLNKRIHDRVGAFNNAISFLHGVRFVRSFSNGATSMISVLEHK